MINERPDRLIDPVCGMSVKVARAEGEGLLLEHQGRTYAFCSANCLRSFVDGPVPYLAGARAAEAGAAQQLAPSAANGLPVIDAGMRRWYESCSCCLSEAFPEVKKQLDGERAAAAQPPVDPGICEVAEAEMAHSH